jgi:hypothetical protein
LPATPKEITEEAYAEMEGLYPDYRQHIQQVKIALGSFQLPPHVRRYSPAGEEYTKNHLLRYQLTA